NRQQDLNSESWFPFLNLGFHNVCFVNAACALAIASSARRAISSGDGKLINTSGGMSPALASFTRHFWRSVSALFASRSLEKRDLAFSLRSRSRAYTSPPSSAEMSTFIFSRCRSASLTTSPLMGQALYLGNMMAASGQTREQAGQLVLQLSLFCTWILCPGSTP